MSPPNLKIAQLTPYYYPSIGGVEGVAQYISEELSRRGHDVHVLTARRSHKNVLSSDMDTFEIHRGVHIHRFSSLLNVGHMSFFPSCVKLLWRGGFEVFHSHVYRHPHLEIAYQIGRWKNIPTVLHGHAPFLPAESLSGKKKLFYALYDLQARFRVLKKIDRIIALTEYEKQHYRRLGVPAGKITIIPNAAADDCFTPTDPAPFLAKHGLAGKRILLFVGNLNSAKRPDLLIRALPPLIQRVPGVYLLIVGPDEGWLSRIRELAAELQVEDYYRYTGPLYGTEKAQSFASAELFLLPSDLDALPLVLVEAMAHGLPVIGSDAIGPSEIIDHGRNGFIFQRGRVDQLVDACLGLLSDPALSARMSKQARITAERRYTVSGAVDRIEALYFDMQVDRL